MFALIRRLIAAHRTSPAAAHPTAPYLAAVMERAAIERLGHAER